VKASSAGVDAILYLRRSQFELAEESLTIAEQVFETCDATRSHLNIIAGRIALKIFRDHGAPTDSELKRFLDLHSRVTGYNDLDWPTYVLYCGLQAREMNANAFTLLDGYIRKHRRERSKLLPELEELWKSCAGCTTTS